MEVALLVCFLVGLGVGFLVGLRVGLRVGFLVGLRVGLRVGFLVGFAVGLEAGAAGTAARLLCAKKFSCMATKGVALGLPH